MKQVALWLLAPIIVLFIQIAGTEAQAETVSVPEGYMNGVSLKTELDLFRSSLHQFHQDIESTFVFADNAHVHKLSIYPFYDAQNCRIQYEGAFKAKVELGVSAETLKLELNDLLGQSITVALRDSFQIQNIQIVWAW